MYSFFFLNTTIHFFCNGSDQNFAEGKLCVIFKGDFNGNEIEKEKETAKRKKEKKLNSKKYTVDLHKAF